MCCSVQPFRVSCGTRCCLVGFTIYSLPLPVVLLFLNGSVSSEPFFLFAGAHKRRLLKLCQVNPWTNIQSNSTEKVETNKFDNSRVDMLWYDRNPYDILWNYSTAVQCWLLPHTCECESWMHVRTDERMNNEPGNVYICTCVNIKVCGLG